MVGAASFHQPRALRKRYNHGLGFATLIMAALVTIAVLGFQGAIFDLAPMPEIAFTVLVPSGSAIRGSKATNIARQAGADENPGRAPLGIDEAPPPPPGGELYAWEGEDASSDRVQLQTQWLKSLKGKYRPYGHKPWHAHKFTKLFVWVELEPKQGANTKLVNQVTDELRAITAVVPRTMTSRTNDATLGWRQGAVNGVRAEVTGLGLYDFLNRLNTIVLPRIRDFEGLSPRDFDHHGNFRMEVPNQEPFKELDELIDERELVHPFLIGIGNNCFTQRDGLKLMKDYGFPFRDYDPEEEQQDEEE